MSVQRAWYFSLSWCRPAQGSVSLSKNAPVELKSDRQYEPSHRRSVHMQLMKVSHLYKTCADQKQLSKENSDLLTLASWNQQKKLPSTTANNSRRT